MRCTPFRMYLIVTGVFSIGFQIAGIIVEAWWRFSTDTYMIGSIDLFYFKLGLWSASLCHDVETDCISVSYDSPLSGHRGSVIDMLPAGLMVIRVLAMLGAIWACGGILIMAVYFYQQDNRSGGNCGGILSSIAWGISAIVALAAIALALNDYFKLKSTSYSDVSESYDEVSLNMIVYFPWAVVLTSIGGFLAIICGLSLSVRLCRTSSQTYY